MKIASRSMYRGNSQAEKNYVIRMKKNEMAIKIYEIIDEERLRGKGIAVWVIEEDVSGINGMREFGLTAEIIRVDEAER